MTYKAEDISRLPAGLAAHKTFLLLSDDLAVDSQLAKEAGTFDKLLRYPGEDGNNEIAQMDKLGL